MLMSKSGALRRLRSSPISLGGIANPRDDNSERILGGSLRFMLEFARLDFVWPLTIRRSDEIK